eukprot:7692597-Pyramimonas_sp.AAC.1
MISAPATGLLSTRASVAAGAHPKASWSMSAVEKLTVRSRHARRRGTKSGNRPLVEEARRGMRGDVFRGAM